MIKWDDQVGQILNDFAIIVLISDEALKKRILIKATYRLEQYFVVPKYAEL